MKTLGAVLAGGQSSRFGSDKAMALVAGRSLLDRAIAALSPHCERVVIVGRTVEDMPSLPDRPGPGLGPLGGFAAAFDYAAHNGFDQVLTIPVDCFRLPEDIRAILDPAPSCLASQPVIGLWPLAAREALRQMMENGDKLAVRAFAARIGARFVETALAPANINSPADLVALAAMLKERQ